MNLYYFISSRIREGEKGSFSTLASKIAVSIIALGVVVSMLSFSILEGFKSKIEQKIYSLSGQINITKFDLNHSYEETLFNKYSEFYKNQNKYPEIKYLEPLIQKPGLLKSKEEVVGIVLKGIEPTYHWDIFKHNIIEGRTILNSKNNYSKEIIVSHKIARQLNSKLNDSILLCFVQQQPRFRKVKIVGIYETGLEEFDEHIVIGDIQLIRKMFQLQDNEIGSYELHTNARISLDSMLSKLDEDLDYDLGYISIHDKYLQIFEWMNLLDRNVIIFLFLIIGVGMFVMIATLLIMIMERTSMIGMLKAIGTTNVQLRKIFMLNGLYIILKGLVIGSSIGLLLCFIQYYFHIMPLDASTYYMSYVPIEWTWIPFIGINLCFGIVLFLVQWLPVVLISKISPAQSVKFN